MKNFFLAILALLLISFNSCKQEEEIVPLNNSQTNELKPSDDSSVFSFSSSGSLGVNLDGNTGAVPLFDPIDLQLAIHNSFGIQNQNADHAMTPAPTSPAQHPRDLSVPDLVMVPHFSGVENVATTVLINVSAGNSQAIRPEFRVAFDFQDNVTGERYQFYQNFNTTNTYGAGDHIIRLVSSNYNEWMTQIAVQAGPLLTHATISGITISIVPSASYNSLATESQLIVSLSKLTNHIDQHHRRLQSKELPNIKLTSSSISGTTLNFNISHSVISKPIPRKIIFPKFKLVVVYKGLCRNSKGFVKATIIKSSNLLLIKWQNSIVSTKELKYAKFSFNGLVKKMKHPNLRGELTPQKAYLVLLEDSKYISDHTNILKVEIPYSWKL